MQEELSTVCVESVQNEFKNVNSFSSVCDRWRGQPRDEFDLEMMKQDYLNAMIEDAITQDFYYTTYKNNLMNLYNTAIHYKEQSSHRKKHVNDHKDVKQTSIAKRIRK